MELKELKVFHAVEYMERGLIGHNVTSHVSIWNHHRSQQEQERDHAMILKLILVKRVNQKK